MKHTLKGIMYCDCACHTFGMTVKHIMPCCMLCGYKYIDSSDNIVKEALDTAISDLKVKSMLLRWIRKIPVDWKDRPWDCKDEEIALTEDTAKLINVEFRWIDQL